MIQSNIYTCTMHPEIASEEPGLCPKCGMKLVPKDTVVPKLSEPEVETERLKGVE